MDLAASIQAVTEEIMLRCARHVAARTGMRHLVLAGGVALNCVGNGRILQEGIFDELWIQPAAGDAGGALGAALFVWHQLLDQPRAADGVHDRQQGSMLGPRYTHAEIKACLDRAGARYRVYEDERALLDLIVDQIASEQVVGHFHGRMEFGPRALGCRSILGDARSSKLQSVMNLKIKFRESFRPFAPCVLKEDAHEWFEMPPGRESPYMLLVADVRSRHRVPVEPPLQGLTGIDRLKVVRSSIPAVTHVDHSARVQTVDEARHGRFYRLLRRFKERTGCPVIINTSFNVRSEPIVCSPEHAYRCFMATNMDVLVLEDFVLFKEDQPAARKHEVDAYLAQFDLD
jgi:carbamoyltransferase